MNLYLVEFWITSIVLLNATNSIVCGSSTINKKEIDCLQKAESCCNKLSSTYKLDNKIPLYEASCKTSLCNILLTGGSEYGGIEKLEETCERAKGYVYNGSDVAYLMHFETLTNSSPEHSELLLEGLITSPEFDKVTIRMRTLLALFTSVPETTIISSITDQDYPITSRDVLDFLWCGDIYSLYKELTDMYKSYHLFIRVKWIVVSYCHFNINLYIYETKRKLKVHDLKILYDSVSNSAGPETKDEYEKAVKIWITSFLRANLNASHMSGLLDSIGTVSYFLNLSIGPQGPVPRTTTYEINWSLNLVIELSKTPCMRTRNEINYVCQKELVYIACNLKMMQIKPTYIVADFQNTTYNPKYVNLMYQLTLEIDQVKEAAKCAFNKSQIFMFYYLGRLRNDRQLNFQTKFITKLKKYKKEKCEKFMNYISTGLAHFEEICPPKDKKNAHCKERANEMWENAFLFREI